MTGSGHFRIAVPLTGTLVGLMIGIVLFLASGCRVGLPIAEKHEGQLTPKAAPDVLSPILEESMTHQIASFAETNLKAYQWQNRLLLIFAPTVGDPRFETQQHLLVDQAPALDDRDLLLIFAVDEASSSTGLNVLWYEDVDALRAAYGVPSDAFAVFLVGKDGGVKNRFDRPVSTDEIYALIDVMPMRMREMQSDGQ